MSILGGVEKIHNNLNTYTTEDIKVFKFSANEWEAIINDDDYSLLQPIRDWRALGKTPIIEIPTGVLGMSGGRSIGFIYLPLTVVSQSSEYTILGFQANGETLVVAASMACQGTNVINFNMHTVNLPIISGNTVDGELLTIDGAELKTSGISVSDLEDVIALPINIPIPAAELAPVAADLFDYFQAHNGVGYPLINVNGKLYEYSGWTTDDDIITLEYASTSVEEGYLYRLDHVDKIRKYRFIYTDGEFTRVDTDVSWYFGGELANGCPLWVVNSSSEASVITGTFGDMARFINEYGVNKSMGIVYDGWYYLKIHTYSADGDYRKIIFIRLYPLTSNYNSGYSRTYRPTIYLYFTYDSGTGYTYDHYDDSYIIVESPQVLATNVNYATPYTPQYDGSPATKKYVDDSVSGAISAGTTAPSNPTEGQIWYDTTNDVVKVYDGTNWNVVGDDAADINTKTFYLSSTSDLTTAQAVYDWFKAGKNPIIQKSNRIYTLNGAPQNNRRLIFRNITQNDTYYQYAGAIIQDSLTIVSNSDIVSEIINNETIIGTLATDVDYQTPYTPTYNGSPATKKYVDDTVASAKSSGATAPSNPTEGQLWYDTTNDVLKVYNGTTWVEVGGGITNDTTGTTSTISQEWVGTKAEFNALSSYGNKIYNIIE